MTGILAQSVSSVEAIIFVFGGFLLFTAFCLYKGEYTVTLICMVFAIAGFLYSGIFAENIQRKAGFYSGQNVKVRARVVDIIKNDESFSVNVKTEKILKDGAEINDKINIRLYYYEKPKIEYGDIIEFDAKPKKSADLIKAASRTGGALLYCTVSPSETVVCGNKTSKLNPKDAAYFFKGYTEKKIYEYLSGDTAALLLGVLTGNTKGLSDTLKNCFRICGLSHITAVSGMHIGIILTLAASVFALLRMKNHKIAIIFYIALIWFFALIAGLGASVTRAALMTTLFFTAYLLKRDSDAFTSLATTALIMLFANPLVLFDVGFDLSFLATAGILLFAPPLRERLRPFIGAPCGLVAVTCSAQFVTMPVVAYYFGVIPLIGIFANVLLCPLIPVVMALGILFLIFSGISFAASFLAVLLKTLLNGIIYTVIFISNLPNASHVVKFSMVWTLSYILICIALYMFLIKKRRKALYLAALSSAVFFVFITSAFLTSNAYLSFINVGKGDCAVFKTQRAVLMFDGGGNYERDIGREIVLPYLRREGISEVDVAFLTHCHIDHGGGFVPLLKEGIIKNIVLPYEADGSGLFAEIEEAAREGGANVFFINTDKSFDFCGIRVDAVNTADGNEENNGVVYFLTYGRNRACFTGDINKDAERALCKNMSDISCNLLKIAHHGSATSSDSGFLKAVGAKFAVITCAGEKFPAPETVDVLRSEGISFAATKACGNIEINMDRKRFKKVRLERGGINEL